MAPSPFFFFFLLLSVSRGSPSLLAVSRVAGQEEGKPGKRRSETRAKERNESGGGRQRTAVTGQRVCRRKLPLHDALLQLNIVEEKSKNTEPLPLPLIFLLLLRHLVFIYRENGIKNMDTERESLFLSLCELFLGITLLLMGC
ncbi:hypothetical protein PAMP_012822 [Pampus punctatissimus]